VKTSSFSDAIIAAASIDKLRLGTIATNNDGAIFGAIADSIGSLKGHDADGQSVKLKDAKHPDDALRSGDFDVATL
jgi:hypothetical protein